MQEFREIEQKLAQAEPLGDELTASWESFQFIVTVAGHYADQTSGWFAKWMSVIPPACEGRDYLGLAPSMRHEPEEDIEPLDLEALNEDDAARALASIAAALLKHLPAAAAAATDPADARACAKAAEAAAEVRDLLAMDG